MQKPGYCPPCLAARRRVQDMGRGGSTERLYTSRWFRERKLYLRANPFCVDAVHGDVLVPAVVVDHHVPHGGDFDKFWDASNWRPLCKRCHDRKTARYDGGFGNAKRLQPHQ